ncbi:MAG TPA: amino acid adenylation domain-containing protein, partial [Myxococcales bacterium]|nr:amino acid adenylation domain-containing protein [Myxococcales bacterium]
MHPDPRGPGRTLLPLTQAQTAMWMRWKYAEQSSAYNNPLLFELLGDVDVQRLGAACSALVDRHDVVRARFVEIDGVPFQEIVPRERPALELRDLSTLPEPLREKRKEEMLAAALKAPFDLTREAVHRFALVRMEDRRHLLAMNIHHICADGISASILLEEIAADYEGTSPPPAVAPGIARFLEHEAAVPAEARAESERFWTGELRHARPAVDFGAIQRTDTEPSGPGAARHLFKLGAAERKAVGALARRTRSTLFTVLAAALDVLLWRCTGQADITLMYPVDIRPRELKRQFGCHINYVPLVLSLRREMTVAELIQAAVQARTRSRPHEHFPHLEISRIARKSGPPFNTAITAANFALDLFSLRGLEVRPHLVHAGGAKEDLGLLFDAQGEELALILEYRRSIWRDEVIRELGADLLHLLGQMAADESVRLGALQLRGDRPFAERFLAAEVPGAGGDLSALFEERLERAGDRVVASGPERAFSARALRGLAQGAAELLLERGVRAGDRVAVQASRSPLLLPAILGAWKIGASYVPVEPELPPARSRFILEDAAPRLVLTDAELALLREREPRGPPAELRGGEVAYVIYTSGSTGTPKGVEVTRSNLAAFLRAMEALLPVRAESRLLAVTTIGFDISLLELFLPLVAGGTVLIYPAEQVRDAFALPALLEQERVDVLQATPSFFRMLVGAGWTGKKDLVALAGGEPLEEKTAGVLLRGCRELWNLYGPTETTVWSMAARLEDASRIDLGRPIPGTSVHLLLAGGLPVPRYGRGEIWLGGAGVARGYRGLPQLTAERFAELPGLGRAYRTGDVAERTGDDAIHFVGRADGQVKIRGFRVELG